MQPLLSPRIEPCMSPWGWPRGLVHNLQISRNTRFLRTRFYVQERPSSIGVLQPYFKSSKGISRTSLHRGVLTKIRRQFFSTICSTQENKEMTTDKLHTRTTFHVSSIKNSFFGSRVAGFASDPSHLKYWPLHPFFYKEATCKGSTVKGLPYPAKAVPSKDYFTHLTLKNSRNGCWAIRPDYRASHPWRFCAVGDVVAQRYDVLHDWLWDTCHMAGVRWGSRCKGFRSKEGLHYHLEQSMRKLS